MAISVAAAEERRLRSSAKRSQKPELSIDLTQRDVSFYERFALDRSLAPLVSGYRGFNNNRGPPIAGGPTQSPHQMQKLHMAFVLVEDVVDDLLFGVASQVIVLTAFTQVHFSTVVAAVAQLLFFAKTAPGE